MADFLSLRLQAEAGDARAQVLLARAMLLGVDVPYAPDDALRLLNTACERQAPEAIMLRAAISAMGLAVPRNFAEAFELLSRAAALGDAGAKGQLAALSDAKGAFDLEVWRAKADVTQHFDTPRIFTLKNFIPKAACDWLISSSRARLRPSEVYSDQGSVVDTDRTSSVATRSNIDADLVLQLVNLRIAGATGTPLLNQEPGNVLHYAVGQENKPHFDFLSGEHVRTFAEELREIGQRVGTLLIYLNGGYAGGETEFPRLDWRFRGEPGDALFFWNVSAKGDPEVLSRHAGLPVTQGEKWLLSKWIRSKQVPLWWPRPG